MLFSPTLTCLLCSGNFRLHWWTDLHTFCYVYIDYCHYLPLCACCSLTFYPLGVATSYTIVTRGCLSSPPATTGLLPFFCAATTYHGPFPVFVFSQCVVTDFASGRRGAVTTRQASPFLFILQYLYASHQF